eukprot:4115728-Pleurochrysis_carterae.AAC.1
MHRRNRQNGNGARHRVGGASAAKWQGCVEAFWELKEAVRPWLAATSQQARTAHTQPRKQRHGGTGEPAHHLADATERTISPSGRGHAECGAQQRPRILASRKAATLKRNPVDRRMIKAAGSSPM